MIERRSRIGEYDEDETGNLTKTGILVKQRWLNEEDAVEMMDGWVDGESTRKTLRTTFLLR